MACLAFAWFVQVIVCYAFDTFLLERDRDGLAALVSIIRAEAFLLVRLDVLTFDLTRIAFPVASPLKCTEGMWQIGFGTRGECYKRSGRAILGVSLA
jgi:hypothetical protein